MAGDWRANELRSSIDTAMLDAGLRAHRARALALLVLWTVGIATVALVVLIALEPASLARRATSIAVLWLSAGATLALNRRGYTRMGSALFVAGLIALVTQRAWHLGGIQGPLGPGYIVVAMMATALLGARGGALAASACLACAIALVLAEDAGLLPATPRFSSTALLLYFVLFMGLALVVQRVIASQLGAALARMQAELLERQRAQRRLALALEAGKVSIWEQDPATLALRADARLFEAYGLPVPADGTMAWDEWRARVHPDDLARLQEMLTDLKHGASEVSAELRVIRPDGTQRYFQGAAGAFTEDGVGSARFVGVSVDISDLKLAQVKQEQLVCELRDRIKELELLHAVARCLQRRTPSQAQVLHEIAALIPSGWQHSECCEARVVCGGEVLAATDGFRETPWMQVGRFWTSDGEGRIEVVYTAEKPRADEGPFTKEERAVLDSIAEMVASHLELRKHQRQLEQLVATRTAEVTKLRDAAQSASGVKGAFLTNMSHEIRTPLNAILGYAQLLSVDPSLGEAQRRQVQVVRASGEHLLGLINDILEMSRIDAGRSALAEQAFDLPALLEQLRSMFGMQIAARGLRLVIETSELMLRGVRADPGKVRQVLINLVGNAVKFTERGSVVIRACSEPAHAGGCVVTIHVADTGCGIDPADQARIFEAFSQAERGVQKGGTGLGLTISRDFARLMGGELNVVSTPGEGSAFTFSFLAQPVADAEIVAPEAPGVLAMLDRAGPKPKALVVDDVASNRDLLHEILARAGLDARTASSGEEAVAQAAAWAPDLVLLDVHMPGLDGFEATRRIRAASSAARVIVTTASADESVEHLAREAGADCLLRKPVQVDELLQAIERQLGVRFVRTTPSSPPPPQQPAGYDAFAKLPDALVKELREAAEQARSSRLIALTARAEVDAPQAAKAIRTLALDFRYREILHALKEANHGA